MKQTMLSIFGVGAAGFLGAISRYLLSGWVYGLAGGRLPWGTLAVNVAGSFLLGIVYILSVERSAVSPELRVILAVGFLGSLTTFSTFSMETVNLLREGNIYLSLTNILLNMLLSFAAVIAGMAVAKVF